jgi:hypothetical protein
MPSELYIVKKEKAVLWFSANQQWEPTACKMRRISDGTLERLDMEGTLREGGGLVRFGVDRSTLFHWPRLIKEARIPAKIASGLIRAGKEQGAMHSDWWGSVKPVSVEECAAIEVYDDGVWVRVR